MVLGGANATLHKEGMVIVGNDVLVRSSEKRVRSFEVSLSRRK